MTDSISYVAGCLLHCKHGNVLFRCGIPEIDFFEKKTPFIKGSTTFGLDLTYDETKLPTYVNS